jgi:periplasmic protein TonB
MPFSIPEFSDSDSEASSSWRGRVLENLRVAFSIPHQQVHPANTAPGPFASVNTSTRYGSAQGISMFTHIGVLTGIVLLLASTNPPVTGVKQTLIRGIDRGFHFFPPAEQTTGKPSLGPVGGGSNHDSALAKIGNLVPPSSMPLAPPRLPHSNDEALPVPPSVFDPDAPAAVPITTNLGLPWMEKDTNSAGKDGGKGIGNRPGNAMGDDDGEEAGAGGPAGNYANVVSQPACLHCPEPPYTDEARKAKLQGNVTLRVLIGADGRASRIQLVKGLGMGLDEQALLSVRSWRFIPARDARREPVPTWVTIETRFQLF